MLVWGPVSCAAEPGGCSRHRWRCACCGLLVRTISESKNEPPRRTLGEIHAAQGVDAGPPAARHGDGVDPLGDVTAEVVDPPRASRPARWPGPIGASAMSAGQDAYPWRRARRAARRPRRSGSAHCPTGRGGRPGRVRLLPTRPPSGSDWSLCRAVERRPMPRYTDDWQALEASPDAEPAVLRVFEPGAGWIKIGEDFCVVSEILVPTYVAWVMIVFVFCDVERASVERIERARHVVIRHFVDVELERGDADVRARCFGAASLGDCSGGRSRRTRGRDRQRSLSQP